MQIYKITNNVNGKIYIGKDSRDKKNYFGSGIVIKCAIKKYGKHNFSKEILEECDNHNTLNEKEIYWISFYQSTNFNIGYNRSHGGDGFCGITVETKEKLSKIRKGKILPKSVRDKISKSNKGKPKSKKHRKSLSNAWKKRKIEHPHTKETLEKMSISMLGKNAKNTYKLIDKNNHESIINNLTQFAKNNNLQRTLLSKVASGKRKHHKGWRCEKINK